MKKFTLTKNSLSGSRWESDSGGGTPLRLSPILRLTLLLVLGFFLAGVSQSYAQTDGPFFPATTAGSGGGTVWTAPGNVTANDVAYATATIGSVANTEYLLATNFSFAIPAGSVIDGIEVTISRFADNNIIGNSVSDFGVWVGTGGVNAPTNLGAVGFWPTSETIQVYGGPSTLWGQLWSPAQINSSTFGVAIAATIDNATASINYVTVSVTYTPSSVPIITGTNSLTNTICQGTPLIINGINFTGATAVTINAIAVASFNVDNANQITAQTTNFSSGTVGPIVITTPGPLYATSPFTMTVNGNPTIIINPVPDVCFGATSATLTLTGGTNSPDQYSIDYDAAAEAVFFVDVPTTTIPGANITLVVPGAAAPATYNATITVTNSVTGCVGTPVPFTVTIQPLPTITLGAFPAVCEGTTAANLTYSGTTNSPDQYSIDYDVTAEGQGFADVTLATLPISPIALVVPGAAAPAVYNANLTVTNSSTGCVSIVYPITVTVNGNPTITLGANPAVCSGVLSANLTYSATTYSPDQYSIDYDVTANGQGFVDVVLSALPASPIVLVVPGPAIPATYNGSLTVTNSSTGCVSAVYPITVTINPLPTPVITGPASVCENDLGVAYSTPNNVGSSYVWVVGGGSVATGGGTAAVTIDWGGFGLGTVDVTETNSFGCVAAATQLAVTINPLPTITLGVFPSVCEGSTSANLPYSGTTNTPDQYSVDYDAAAEAAGFVDVTNSALPPTPIVLTVPGAAAAAVYNASLTVSNSVTGCVSLPTAITVTVNPVPVINNLVVAQPFCSGDTFTVTPVDPTDGVVPPGTTYAWAAPVDVNILGLAAGGPGATSITGTLTNTTSSPITVVYTVTPTTPFPCTGANFTVSVTINPRPLFVAPPVAVIESVCQDGTASTLGLGSSAGFGTVLSYQWMQTDIITLPITTPVNVGVGTHVAAVGTGANSDTFTPSTAIGGTLYFYCIVTNSYNCSALSPIMGALTVNDKPVISVDPNPAAQYYCVGGGPIPAFSVTATPGSGAITNYEWFSNTTATNTGGTSVASGVGQTTYVPSDASASVLYYYVVVTNSNGCSRASNVSGVVDVKPVAVAPVITKNPVGAEVCVGTILTVGVTAGSGGSGPLVEDQYRYDDGSGFTAWSTTVPSFAAGLGVNTIEAQRFNTGIGCGVPFNSVSWTVDAQPVGPVIAVSPASPACAGTALTITVTTAGTGGGTGAADEFRFSTDNGGSWSAWSTSLPSFAAVVGTNWVESRRVSPNTGCATAAGNSVSWTVEPQPVSGSLAKTPNTSAVCDGEDVSAVLTPGTGGAGTVVDVLEFRTNGGGWAAYISGTPISTTGLTSVDIQTYRTASGSGCTTSTPVVVGWTVNPLPIVTPVAPQVICSGNATLPVTLASSIPGSTFAWTSVATSGTTGNTASGNGNIPAETLTNSTLTAGTVTYTIVATSPDLCVGPSVDFVVTVNPLPTVDPILPQAVCSGGTTIAVVPTSTPSGALFGWTSVASAGVTGNTASGSGTIPAETLSKAWPGQGTVTYTITPELAGCPGPTYDFVVTVNPIPPTPVATSSGVVCDGETLYLYATNTPAIPGATYSWIGPNGFTSSVQNPVVAVPFAALAVGQYTVTVSLNGCTSVVTPLSQTTVTTSVPTAVSGNALSNVICQGQTIQLRGQATGATLYRWSRYIGVPLTPWQASPDFDITNAQPSDGGVYYFEARNSCGIAATVNTGLITVNPLPTPVIVGTSPVCELSGGSVYSVTNVTGNTYTWAVVGGTFTGQGTSSITVTWGAAGAGTVDVTETVASTTCSQAAVQLPVVITAIPTFTFAYSGIPGTPFCKSLPNGYYPVISGTGAYTGGTYSSTAGLTIDPTLGYVVPASSDPGTYTVTYTIPASGGCAAVPVTTQVTITAVPTADISYAGTPFCTSVASAQPVTLTGTGAYTGGTYASAAGLSISASTGAITPGTSTPGTYTVTYTGIATGGCAAVVATTSVTITALPTATISYTGTPFCKSLTTGQPVNLGGTGAYLGGAFTSTTGLTIDALTGDITPSTSTAGTYTVTYTIPASGGCAAVPVTTSVTITAVPTATLTYPLAPACTSVAPINPTLNGTGAYTGGIYTSTTGLTLDATTGVITPGTSTPGTYTVTYTIPASAGCAAVDASTTVTIKALPNVFVSGNSPICIGGVTTLSPGGLGINGTWVSNNTAVATVNALGVVTGVGPGTTNFTFTSSITGCSATTPTGVTVNAPVVGITGPDVICVRSTTTLTPVNPPANPGVWVSNNPTVASVSVNGVVTGLTPGTATFTYTETATGCSNTTLPVTVNGVTVGISGPTTICVTTTTQLTATQGGTWVSNNPGVATVSNTLSPVNTWGRVTGVSGGTATFTLTSSVNGCTETTAVVTVNPALVAPGIPAPTQIVCYGTPALTLTATPASGGGTGGFTYQWYKWVSSVWTPISGATGLSYTPTEPLYATQLYRVVATNTFCGTTVQSGNITVNVYAPLTNPVITYSDPLNLCAGSTPGVFTHTLATGGSGVFTYQWQMRTTGNWVNVGTGDLTYAPGPVTEVTQFKVIADNVGTPYCGAYESNIITLGITPETGTPVFAMGASSERCQGGGTIDYTATATNTTGITFTLDPVGAGSITNVVVGGLYAGRVVWNSGFSGTATITANADGCNPKTSTHIVTVNPTITPTITISTPVALVCQGTSVTFTAVSTNGGPTPNYQWRLTTGASTVNVGTNSDTYTMTPLNGQIVRCIITSSLTPCAVTATSNLITMTVNPTFVAPTVSANQTICNGATPALLTRNAASGGNGSYTYQWQTLVGSTWTDIGVLNATSFQPGSLFTTTSYRVLATTGGPCPQAISNVVVITVNNAFADLVISAPQTICNGTAPAALTSPAAQGGSGNFLYQWQSKTTGGWSNVGTSSLTYQSGALTQTTTFRLIATDTGVPSCGSIFSNEIIVTVNNALTGGTVIISQVNSVPFHTEILNVTLGTGGTSYKWQSSAVNGEPWVDVPGATGSDYDPGPIPASTWYRRVTVLNQNSIVCFKPSNAVQIVTTVLVNAKVNLEGAWNGSSMNTVLPVPTAHPYSGAPWNHVQGTATVPAGVVDWVLVEIRHANAPANATKEPINTILGVRAAFLMSDGSIVDPDPTVANAVRFDNVVVPAGENLYVVIRHRNHLAIMSATGAVLTAGVYNYDFTTGLTQAYGPVTGYKLVGTTPVMVAGDIDHDNMVAVSDYAPWAADFGKTAGYFLGDLDMNGSVFVSDYNKWVGNFITMGNGIIKSGRACQYFSSVPK